MVDVVDVGTVDLNGRFDVTGGDGSGDPLKQKERNVPLDISHRSATSSTRT
jgi:hypothetical protein